MATKEETPTYRLEAVGGDGRVPIHLNDIDGGGGKIVVLVDHNIQGGDAVPKHAVCVHSRGIGPGVRVKGVLQQGLHVLFIQEKERSVEQCGRADNLQSPSGVEGLQKSTQERKKKKEWTKATNKEECSCIHITNTHRVARQFQQVAKLTQGEVAVSNAHQLVVLA